MRELTKNEKNVIRALLKDNNVDSPTTVGDILKQLYSISYIGEPSYSDSPLNQDSVTVIMAQNPKVKKDLYEAIALIWELVYRRYLIVKEFIPVKSEPINSYIVMSMMESPQDEFEDQMTIFNYSENNLWSLLNSKFITTNALADFAKDDKFQTIEQRRHNESKSLAILGIIVAILIGLIATGLSIVSILISLCDSIKNILASFLKIIVINLC